VIEAAGSGRQAILVAAIGQYLKVLTFQMSLQFSGNSEINSSKQK